MRQILSFHKVILLWVLVLPSISFAEANGGFDHDHLLLDTVLQKYVENGLVDYRGLLKDRGGLHRYLEQIANVDRKEYQAWSRPEKLTFWINAYNALTIEAVLRHYPIGKPTVFSLYPKGSIRHIEGVWDKMKWKVAGENFTLEHIEHEILRKQLAEPRIHFVLVCASVGCPLLEHRAFRAATIEKRLNSAAHDYINRDSKVMIDIKRRIVWFPMIFDWFGEDFESGYSDTGLFAGRGARAKGLLHFVYRYLPPGKKTLLRKNEFTIRYLPYDWSLNEKQQVSMK